MESTCCKHPRSSERGVALVLAILFTIIVVGLVTTGSLVLRSHQVKTQVNFIAHGQSVQFAKSGLIEALGWMRKQTSQPVLDFEPVLNMGASPPIMDTIDPAVGIVREFQITGSIWGRYEVWKEWAGDPNPQRLLWRQQMQSEDISTLRGNLAPGSVWRVRSLGYVFRRNDGAVAFNQPPNLVLGQDMTEVEARRLALQPPGQAALCTQNGSLVQLQTRARIVANGETGIYYNGSATPATFIPIVTAPGASITAAQQWVAATPPLTAYDDSFEAVFGVSQQELTAMADYVVNNAPEFPSPVPLNSVVLSNIGMTFNASQPLRGTGIVTVIGNTTISQGSYSAFSGLLYVQGNLTVREPCEIQGAVIVTGSVTLQGASDFVTLTYDDGILTKLRTDIGTYRLSSAMSRPMAQDR